MDPAPIRKGQVLGRIKTLNIVTASLTEIAKGDHLPDCAFAQNKGDCNCGKVEAETSLVELRLSI